MQSSGPITLLYLRSPLSVPPSKTRDVFSAGCPMWCAGQTQWGETIGGYHSVVDLPSCDLLRAQLSYAILAPVNVTAFIGVPYASATRRDGQYKTWMGGDPRFMCNRIQIVDSSLSVSVRSRYWGNLIDL